MNRHLTQLHARCCLMRKNDIFNSRKPEFRLCHGVFQEYLNYIYRHTENVLVICQQFSHFFFLLILITEFKAS